MVNPKSSYREEAERLAKEMPDAPSRTLARRIAKEYSVTIEQARSAVRTARGAYGDSHRKSKVVDRPLGKAGTKPQMPPSLAEDWLPFECPGEKIAAFSDIHAPYHSQTALGAAVKESKKFKPDVVLLNGDTCDFYAISRWQKNPKKRDFLKELESCRQLLQWFRHEFPKAEIIFKKGNHEERWDHYLWNHAPEISDDPRMLLDNWIDAADVGAVVIGDQRPIMCGKLPVMHGHELPKGMTNPVNMARGAFLRMIDTVLVGHGHRSSSHTESTWEHKEITCWSTGCLCDMSPEYARINKWNWGFAFIEVGQDQSFNVQNMRISQSGDVRKS